MSVCLFVCLSVCLFFVFLSVCQFFCLSVCLLQCIIFIPNIVKYIILGKKKKNSMRMGSEGRPTGVKAAKGKKQLADSRSQFMKKTAHAAERSAKAAERVAHEGNLLGFRFLCYFSNFYIFWFFLFFFCFVLFCCVIICLFTSLPS